LKFDLTFDQIDIPSVINDVVPQSQRKAVAAVLTSDSFTEADVDAAGMRLLGDMPSASFILPTGAPLGPGLKKGNLFAHLKAEAYDLFCTNSDVYASERKDGTQTVKNLITILATAAGGTYSVSAAVFTGAATLVVMLVLKMGLNAYCKAHAPE